MAEFIVAAAALSTAVMKLAEVLTKVGYFLLEANAEIKNDIERVSKELKWMESFLEDAENKPGIKNNNVFKTWVTEVGELATQCEAIAYDLLAIEQQNISQKGCLSMSCCFSGNTNLPPTHEINARVKKLLSDIKEISDRRIRYDPNADAGNSSGTKIVDEKLKELRRTTPYTNNEHMVGHDESIRDLTAKLLDRESGQFVISIVGMGGLGKTTLARKLFNSLPSQHFTSRAWVCVSQVYNTKDILMEIINLVTPPTKEERKALTSVPLIETHLRKYLSGHRFLVVIDDVWEREARESLERALFPDNNNGSKVIITTRNKQVAELNNAYVHKLRYLDENESWGLFCQKAFLTRGMECPSHLEKIGREMVTKCSGLPLAIIILGGILSVKSLVFSEWETIRDNLWNELENNSHINAILTISFEDLPRHLRRCFLYIAMFPEDFKIDSSRLMLLWEAEGFVEEGYSRDVTKSYFEELVGRCLFSKPNGRWMDSTFRVHDLLRDLAIRKAREMKFSIFHDAKRTIDVSIAPSNRRLTVFHPQNDIPSEYTNSPLCTLFCWEIRKNISNPPLRGLIQTLAKKFRNLKVLDVRISNASKAIPSSIGDLIHLRFLGFEFNDMRDNYEMPDTIWNLTALQTLSIVSTLGESILIPKTVLKLRQLKHLIGYFKFLHCEIGSLVSLETLAGITGEQWCSLDTTKLVNIRRLELRNIKEANDKFYDNFRYLGKLQTLTLQSEIVRGPAISLEKVFELCPNISYLKTNGMDLNNSLNLDRFAVKLEVIECSLFPTSRIQDLITSFGKLPQLEALQVYVYNVPKKEEICVNEGFAQLRYLRISFTGYKLIASEGCMPLLELLAVNNPSSFQGPHRMMRLVELYEQPMFRRGSVQAEIVN